jgi:hypothetical protein
VLNAARLGSRRDARSSWSRLMPTATVRPCVAMSEESLLYLMDSLVADPWRLQQPFSMDFAPWHEGLLAAADDTQRAKLMDEWLGEHQPCLFGRHAAKQGRIAYCFLTQQDLDKDDDHVAGRIARARLNWRRRGRSGTSSAFVIVVISDAIARAQPDGALLRVCQRLVELYLCREAPSDRILHDELFLETAEHRSWRVGVNFFGAQGDGRWWKDHRMPGGVALSMNSVGHHACVRRLNKGPTDPPQLWGLDQALILAMRLLDATTAGPSGRNTWLHAIAGYPEPAGASCSVEMPAILVGKNRFQYGGQYHTDQTLPRAYFDASVHRPAGPTVDDLDLTYLFLDSPDNPDYQSMGLGSPQA